MCRYTEENRVIKVKVRAPKSGVEGWSSSTEVLPYRNISRDRVIDPRLCLVSDTFQFLLNKI